LAYCESTAQYLSDGDVERIIQRLRTPECTLQLRGRDGLHGLKSALNQPAQTFDGKDLYPTLGDKAAIMLYLLAKNHPFDQGNKRFAWVATEVFLEINGLGIRVDENEMVAWVTWIASKESPTVSQVVEWLSQALYSL